MKLFCAKTALFLSLTACLWSAHPASVRAQATAVATQPLHFGTFAITDFDVVGRITINTNGTYNRTGSIFIIDPPQRGEYTVSGGTPDTDFTITTSPASVTLTGLSNPLTVDNFVVTPSNARTDVGGNETFTISARLSTGGGGLTHADGSHDGNFDVIMNF